jgi:hypothetical protein
MYLFLFIAYDALLGFAFLLTFLTLRRKIRITDISLNDNRSYIKTCSPHYLCERVCKRGFPVDFTGTKHPLLDEPKSQFFARVNLATELELLDRENNPIDRRLDTSRGTVTLPFPHDFIHTGLALLPVAVLIPLLLAAAAVVASLQLSSNSAFEGALGSFVASLATAVLKRWFPQKTPLDKLLDEYLRNLKSDGCVPTPCSKGPKRAIAVGKLLDTHEFFRTQIKDRNAYYMDGNIFKPLTEPTQLSFAELVGSSPVEWFVSHYWGTPFSHFCESLRCHAVSKVDKGGTTRSFGSHRTGSSTSVSSPGSWESWQDTAYWVCFCSINQYRVKEELGESWRESSFFITLQSGLCRGTCMVLDRAAMPLTRSWCIFELLQTLKLEGQDNFQGLELSTASGLLNEGQSTVEVAVNLVKRMATLDLEGADASCARDRDMINSLVVEEFGSFDIMNAFMRREMYRVLTQARTQFSKQFERMYTLLATVVATDSLSTPHDSEEDRHTLLRNSFRLWSMAVSGTLSQAQLACMLTVV